MWVVKDRQVLSYKSSNVTNVIVYVFYLKHECVRSFYSKNNEFHSNVIWKSSGCQEQRARNEYET